jgi:hypothetical protein
VVRVSADRGFILADFSLIKIDGELTKPASILIEKVSSALGILYEPTNIRRKAKAEADANIIKSLATIEITEIEERAINRLVKQEARKQKNIEHITLEATSNLPSDADVENIQEDWIAHFFAQCENVSDVEMQSVWSKLLTGEATKPGTFSKRTIDFVSSLDKKDADLFTKFCKFVWQASELVPLIFNHDEEIYKRDGITFQNLLHLESIGLIKYDTFSGFNITFDIQNDEQPGRIGYYTRLLNIEFPTIGKHNIKVGTALLTKIGMELATICGSEPKQDFYDYCIKKIAEQNFILSSHLDAKGF